MEWRSRRLGTGHLLHPTVDQGARVVRAGAGLGMELERPRPQLRILEALDRPVVERHVGGLLALARLDREPVVLTRDEHPTRTAFQNRVVRAAMAERQLE